MLFIQVLVSVQRQSPNGDSEEGLAASVSVLQSNRLWVYSSRPTLLIMLSGTLPCHKRWCGMAKKEN